VVYINVVASGSDIHLVVMHRSFIPAYALVSLATDTWPDLSFI